MLGDREGLGGRPMGYVRMEAAGVLFLPTCLRPPPARPCCMFCMLQPFVRHLDALRAARCGMPVALQASQDGALRAELEAERRTWAVAAEKQARRGKPRNYGKLGIRRPSAMRAKSTEHRDKGAGSPEYRREKSD